MDSDDPVVGTCTDCQTITLDNEVLRVNWESGRVSLSVRCPNYGGWMAFDLLVILEALGPDPQKDREKRNFVHNCSQSVN